MVHRLAFAVVLAALLALLVGTTDVSALQRFTLIGVQTSESPGSGQTVVTKGKLLSHHKVVGHDSFVCTPSGQEAVCKGKFKLRHGTIRVKGAVGTASTSIFKIRGGTGRYSGAKGQVVSHDLQGGGEAGTRAKLIFQLK